MKTREELISGLQYALNLMRETANLQNKRNNLLLQYVGFHTSKEPWGKTKLLMTGIATGIATIILVPVIIVSIMQFLFGIYFENPFIAFIALVLKVLFKYSPIPIGILSAIFIPKVINQSIEKKNRIIQYKNEEIKKRNITIAKSENAIIERLKSINKEYGERILPWYPNDYCYIDAAFHFLHYIENYRADNMKEAINLYLDEEHKRRMEQSQQEMLNKQESMIRQQKLNNILTVGSLVMQAGIQNAVNQNTAAVNNMNNTIRRRT